MDLIQAQTIGRSTKRRLAPGKIGGLVEQGREVIESEGSLGGPDSCSGQEADHLVEKSFAGEGEEVALRERREGSLTESPLEVGFCRFVAPVGGKGPEIVATMEEGQGVLEGVRIELAREMPDPASLERGQDGSGAEFVVVGLGEGRKARVKVIRYLLAFQNPDGGRQPGVKSGQPVHGIHGELIRGVKVSDLAGGMDA